MKSAAPKYFIIFGYDTQSLIELVKLKKKLLK